MKLQSPVVFLIAALTVLILGGCASDSEEEANAEAVAPEVVAETVQPVVTGPIDEVEPLVEEAKAVAPAAFSANDALLQIKSFYFNYDSAELVTDSDDSLDAHAETIVNKLGSNPNMVVSVEGHADERGTIEYNNALGNKRAESVARYLRLKGVPADNIETISYGELRPVAEGQNEASWALNRRVVLDY